MRIRIFSIAALVCAGALSMNAQQPPEQQRPPQQQRPPTGDTTQRTMATPEQTVTVTGCLKAEKDVPGRRPNAAERATTENYVLTGVKMAPGGTTSAIGLASTLDVQGLAEAEVQKHLNHQVEITGRITTGDAHGNRGTAPATNPGAERREGTPQAAAHADLPNIQATSLKMVSATCTAE